MGANTMRITVVGVVLIVVGVIVGGLLVLALNQKMTILKTQQNGGVQLDPPPSQGDAAG
jgi:hypothetical protein